MGGGVIHFSLLVRRIKLTSVARCPSQVFHSPTKYSTVVQGTAVRI